MANQKYLSAVDYVIFAAVLLMSAGIGVFHALRGGKQRTTSEFLLADRKMSIIPVGISILVSQMSAITILGTPAEMYTAGTQYSMKVFAVLLSMVGLTLFVPLFYNLKLTSVFEYHEHRFKSRAAKIVGVIQLSITHVITEKLPETVMSVIAPVIITIIVFFLSSLSFILTMIYMGIASFAPSTALEAVTKFPAWATIVISMVVATLYTGIGGLKAVVWSDVLQAFVMLCGMLAIVIQGFIKVGGGGKVWELNEKWGRIEFFDFNPDPTIRQSFWSLVFGASVYMTAHLGLSQVAIQRYASLPTLAAAKKALLIKIFGIILLVVLACLGGVAMFAYYAQKGCDPMAAGWVDNANQLVPYFVLEVLDYPGIPGLFLACIFSGSLSSVSSSLHATSAVLWEAFFQPIFSHWPESRQAMFTKLIVVVTGCIGVGIGFAFQSLGGTVLQASMSFVSTSMGGVMGGTVLGAFFPCANWIGFIVGSIAGFIIPMWIAIGHYATSGQRHYLPSPTENCPKGGLFSTLHPLIRAPPGKQFSSTTMTPLTTTVSIIHDRTALERFYDISYLYYAAMGVFIAITVGIIVSRLTGPMDPKDVDSKYLVPVFDKLCPFLPERWRRPLRCGAEYEDDEDAAQTKEVEKEKKKKRKRRRKPEKIADSPFSLGTVALGWRSEELLNKSSTSDLSASMAYMNLGFKDSSDTMTQSSV